MLEKSAQVHASVHQRDTLDRQYSDLGASNIIGENIISPGQYMTMNVMSISMANFMILRYLP
jgi:hypothetical protein